MTLEEYHFSPSRHCDGCTERHCNIVTTRTCQIQEVAEAAKTEERKRIEEVIMPKVQKFIDKVESGNARSRETYADMLLIKELFNQ